MVLPRRTTVQDSKTATTTNKHKQTTRAAMLLTSNKNKKSTTTSTTTRPSSTARPISSSSRISSTTSHHHQQYHHHNNCYSCSVFVKWMVLFGLCALAHYLIVEFTKHIENNKTMRGELGDDGTTRTTTIPLNPQRRLMKVLPKNNNLEFVVEEEDDKVVEKDEVEYFFQLPPHFPPPLSTSTTTTSTKWSSSSTSVGRGVVLLFHGCTHDGIDWFQLPEERKIVKYLLSQGFAVVSISSFDRTVHKCWETTTTMTGNDNVHINDKDDRMEMLRHGNRDVYRIIQTLPQLLSEMMIDNNTTTNNNDQIIGSRHNNNNNNINNINKDSSAPTMSTKQNWMDIALYGIGASSGGDFVSVISQYVPFHGMNVMIAPGKTKAWRNVSNLVSSSKYGSSSSGNMVLYHSKQQQQQRQQHHRHHIKDNDNNSWAPRIAFVYMPIDKRYGSTRNIERSMTELLQQSKKREKDDENGNVDSQQTPTTAETTTTTTTATTTTTITTIPVRTFICDPIPVTPEKLVDHFGVQDPNHIDVQRGNSAYLTVEEATQFVEQLSSSSLNAIDETTHLLTKDPRRIWHQIEPIIANNIFSSQQQQQQQEQQRQRSKQTQVKTRRRKSPPPQPSPQARPSASLSSSSNDKDNDIIDGETQHEHEHEQEHRLELLIESFREVLNVLYAQHEMTSQHIDDVVQFWLLD